MRMHTLSVTGVGVKGKEVMVRWRGVGTFLESVRVDSFSEGA